MAGVTLKAVIDYWKKDGTANVRIRVTHQRQPRPVSTSIFVTKADVTRGGKIKNDDIIDAVDDTLKRWRKIVLDLGVAADVMTVDQVVDHIKSIERNGKVFELDFVEYGRKIADQKSAGTAVNYHTALNALLRFTEGQSIDISRINVRFLESFEQFIENEPVYRGDSKAGVVPIEKSKAGGRAVSHYLANLRHIHNRARDEFNDEDTGIIRVPLSPFKKYKVKRQPKQKKRAVDPDVMQAIINLPDRAEAASRRDLARDCVILSFCLAGMNAVDLYRCPAQRLGKKEKVIVYNRSKTRTRRDDEAEMHIRIEPIILQLVEKYKDPSGEKLFCFHKRYASPSVFNSALKAGLNDVEKVINPDKHITFYSFRHSWATIARSIGIDKYTVHEALNHTDTEMKATDIYIERNYRHIWDANAKVLDLFDWSALLDREDN
ncbi:phage integrase SAM-like domain-containing protein [uncultured Alistipes sp.]|jgi:transposase|uniref:tyrosine-type recombinase/integrase n=1 Tax=uncultured Alistipes sp. TaxID=538949 RepID=UPI0025EBCC32|nr:phage integrase SAM-like domain-containing protein [uncultured Alistipes sp.]